MCFETLCQILGCVCALPRLQESRTMLLDHAELCSQETRRNTEANGPCQALLGMRGICKKPPHGTTGLVDTHAPAKGSEIALAPSPQNWT